VRFAGVLLWFIYSTLAQAGTASSASQTNPIKVGLCEIIRDPFQFRDSLVQIDVIVLQGETTQYQWHVRDDSCAGEMRAYWTPGLVKLGKGHDLKRTLDRHGGTEAMIIGTVSMNDTLGFEIVIQSVEKIRYPEKSRDRR